MILQSKINWIMIEIAIHQIILCKQQVMLIQTSSNTEQIDNISNNELLNITIINNSIFIAASNEITAPNGKVLSINYTYPRKVEYRNIKTNQISYKHIDKPNNEFYKMLFKDEIYDYDTKIKCIFFKILMVKI